MQDLTNFALHPAVILFCSIAPSGDYVTVLFNDESHTFDGVSTHFLCRHANILFWTFYCS